MKRPMVFAVIFFIVGILAGQYLSIPFGVVLFFSAAVFAFISFKEKWGMKFFLIFLLFFVMGFSRFQWKYNDTEVLLENLSAEKNNIIVEGMIREIGISKENGVAFKVESNMVTAPFGEKIENPVVFKVWIEGKTQFFIGDTVAIGGQVTTFSDKPSTTGFIESRYYRTKGYDYKLTANSIQKIGTEKGLFLLREHMQHSLEQVYHAVLPSVESGILKAMVMGDKSDLSEDIQTLYSKGGIAHILAVSGLHASFVVLAIFFLFQKGLRWNKRICAGITMVIAVGYLFFVGIRASIFRAIVMVLVQLLAKIIYERDDNWTNLALAGFCILLYEPFYLWDIGFQLSFAAVSGILVGNTVMERFDQIPMCIKSTIGISLFATLGSYPVVAYYFYEVSLIGIFVNVIVLPMMGILLGMGIFVGLVGQISLTVAHFFAGSVYIILQFFEGICKMASAIPGSCVTVGQPTVAAIVAYYGIFLALCYEQNEGVRQSVVMGCSCIIFVSFFGNDLFWKKDMITFLDVGQGDCTVVITSEKNAYVIDGGGHFYRDFGENTGHLYVMPYLRQQGIAKIKGVFMTHMDFDHATGAIELLEEMPVEGVYISENKTKPSQVWEQFSETVKKNQVPLYTIKAGDTAMLSNEMKIECLSPYPTDFVVDTNENSLVLRLVRGKHEILLMGDAGFSEEEAILEKEVLVSADVLKVGHHGSRNGTGEAWLQTVAPQYAVLSYGKGNRYGHPHIETIKRLQKQKIILLDTERQGSITMKTNGEKWFVHTVAEGRKQ